MTRLFGMLTIALSLALGTTFAPVRAHAAAPVEAKVSESELTQAISQNLSRVEEFRFIREEARKLGVRAWLFGGTAAGYAHYTKWDLQRTKGDPRFQPDRFDYDYTNIFRSTQDADIVIDGTPEQAQKLQAALAEKYPHLQGSKTAWEVRLLTQEIGDKEPLLKNPDFLNQHTDSNSTGMIELTTPPSGEGVVRDLRDWDSKDPYFLRDVWEGKIHYYFSPKHFETARYRAGVNPEIFSVIRYLTKAFQYELKPRDEDLAKVKKIIDQFTPEDVEKTQGRNWIEKNAKKLIQNAVNIEYAWDTLEKLGLRKKLIELDSKGIENPESLSWWMDKEPLRGKPLGTKGKTAAEVFAEHGWGDDLIVAHETNNFLAYESITRAHTGDPNVLISRESHQGEVAAFGDGFYTKVGRQGARGTGLTIRFRLDPKARLGKDFIVSESHQFIIILNKRAIRVIPESLNFTPLQYFRLLAKSSNISADDLGIREKLKRRISAKFFNLPDTEYRKIEAIVKNDFLKNKEITPVVSEWLSLARSAERSETLDLLKSSPAGQRYLLRNNFKNQQWRDAYDQAHSKKSVDFLISTFRANPAVRNDIATVSLSLRDPELKKILPLLIGGLDRDEIAPIIERLFTQSQVPELRKRLMELVLEKRDPYVIEKALSETAGLSDSLEKAALRRMAYTRFRSDRFLRSLVIGKLASGGNGVAYDHLKDFFKIPQTEQSAGTRIVSGFRSGDVFDSAEGLKVLNPSLEGLKGLPPDLRQYVNSRMELSERIGSYRSKSLRDKRWASFANETDKDFNQLLIDSASRGSAVRLLEQKLKSRDGTALERWSPVLKMLENADAESRSTLLKRVLEEKNFPNALEPQLSRILENTELREGHLKALRQSGRDFSSILYPPILKQLPKEDFRSIIRGADKFEELWNKYWRIIVPRLGPDEIGELVIRLTPLLNLKDRGKLFRLCAERADEDGLRNILLFVESGLSDPESVRAISEIAFERVNLSSHDAGTVIYNAIYYGVSMSSESARPAFIEKAFAKLPESLRPEIAKILLKFPRSPAVQRAIANLAKQDDPELIRQVGEHVRNSSVPDSLKAIYATRDPRKRKLLVKGFRAQEGCALSFGSLVE